MAMLFCSRSVPAQQPARSVGSATVQGVVIDVQSGRRIANARATVAGSGVVRVTDDSGRFVLDSVPSGNQTLQVRAIGFRPSDQALSLTDGERVTLRVEMLAIPVRLDTVRTRASSHDIQGYQQRRNARIGTYFDRDEIAAMKVFDPTEVLRHALNVRVDFSPGAPSVLTGPGVHPKCAPDLWVDGRYRRGVSVGEMNNFIPLDQIEHIEIYTDPYSVPGQFVNFKPGGKPTCGAVIVWTAPPPKKAAPPSR